MLLLSYHLSIYSFLSLESIGPSDRMFKSRANHTASLKSIEPNIVKLSSIHQLLVRPDFNINIMNLIIPMAKSLAKLVLSIAILCGSVNADLARTDFSSEKTSHCLKRMLQHAKNWLKIAQFLLQPLRLCDYFNSAVQSMYRHFKYLHLLISKYYKQIILIR